MLEPSVRHFHVKINKSFVHLVQYGHNENIIKSACPPQSAVSNSSSSRHNAPDLPQSSASISSNSNSLSANFESSPSSSLLAADNKINKLIVFIPGNPGLLGVYHDFLIALYKTTTTTLREQSDKSEEKATTVILAISHNNFDHPDYCDYRSDGRICVDDSELNFIEKSKLDNNGEPHQVELQVINKLIILKRLLKLNLKRANSGADGCQLVFVGHSFGCYIILKLLQDRALAAAHAGTVLVHPALENLALTEKGSVLANYFRFKLDLFARLVAHVAEKLLPKPLRLYLTRWCCSRDFVESSSDIVIDSLAQLVCSITLNALIKMAKSELVSIKNLNSDTMIKPHVGKLRLIYTLGDKWVRDAHRLELGQLYPDLHIEEQQTLHAFTMDPAVVIKYAIKIGTFIQDSFDRVA